MPEYTVYLSGQSFRKAARQIRYYRKQLEQKINKFTEELAKEGMYKIYSVLSEHMDTGETIGNVELVKEGSDGVYEARVKVSSDAILFLEFGSGLAGLDNPAPHAAEHGYGSGTYPEGKRQNPEYPNWANPEGWVYMNGHGQFARTRGMVASMPMYQGGKEIEQKLSEVAKRVFGNG